MSSDAPTGRLVLVGVDEERVKGGGLFAPADVRNPRYATLIVGVDGELRVGRIIEHSEAAELGRNHAIAVLKGHWPHD